MACIKNKISRVLLAMVVWKMDLQLHIQSILITKGLCSYQIQLYVIKLVSYVERLMVYSDSIFSYTKYSDCLDVTTIFVEGAVKHR
jgi:hypothetical protein